MTDCHPDRRGEFCSRPPLHTTVIPTEAGANATASGGTLRLISTEGDHSAKYLMATIHAIVR